MQDFYGRDAIDPCVHDAVLNSIRQMPFRDLVAEIEGEEAAAALEQPSLTTVPDMPTVSTYVIASGANTSLYPDALPTIKTKVLRKARF